MEQVAPPFNLAIPSLDQNMQRAEQLVRAAGESRAELCVLPETFRLCGIPYAELPDHAEDLHTGPSCSMLKPLASQYNMIIVFGLIVQRAAEPQVLDTAKRVGQHCT